MSSLILKLLEVRVNTYMEVTRVPPSIFPNTVMVVDAVRPHR